MRNTIIDLKQSRKVEGKEVYRVVDQITGEKGGWVSKNVAVDKDSWVSEGNILIMKPGARLSLKNTLIGGTHIEINIANGMVLLKNCVVRPYARLYFDTYDRAIVSDSVFGTGSLLRIFSFSDSSIFSISLHKINLGNSARLRVDGSCKSVNPDTIPVMTFNEITVLNSGELSLTDCRGDVLVNGCLVGDDCTVQLDSYKGILIDGFECRWDSKFTLSNIERSEYSKFGSEIIIVDTDISGNSFANLNSSGKVILDNQEIRGIKVTDDGMIVNGVFKSKNQFVEEWNIE